MSINPGLSRVTSLLSHFPPLSIPVVHIAGTNGKGSVSAILDSVLTHAGFQTGRFNSPHLVSVEDSIRLRGGVPVSPEVYAATRAEVERVDAKHACGASLFELLTVTALIIFEGAGETGGKKLDVLLIECGMGGELDATNVFPDELILTCVLSSVDVDHQAFLGDTPGAIARTKAGIVKRGGLIAVGRQNHPEVRDVVEALAQERAAEVIWAGEAHVGSSTKCEKSFSLSPFRAPPPQCVRVSLPQVLSASQRYLDLRLPLPGAHQRDNLSLAISVLDMLRTHRIPRGLLSPGRADQITDTCLQEGVARVRWEGRCSWVALPPSMATPTTTHVLVDGAHNAASAALLRSYIDSLGLPAFSSTTFVLALSHSPPKTPIQTLAPLLREGDRVAGCAFSTPIAGMPWVKSAPLAEIRLAAEELVGGGEGSVWEGEGDSGLQPALNWAVKGVPEGGLVVVCGSLYLVADMFRMVGAGKDA